LWILEGGTHFGLGWKLSFAKLAAVKNFPYVWQISVLDLVGLTFLLIKVLVTASKYCITK